MLYVVHIVVVFFGFFFKQKTAYEMRISDWSSDVCSSDLQDCGRLDRDHEDDHRARDIQGQAPEEPGLTGLWHAVPKIPKQFLLKIYQSGLAVAVQTNTKDLL